MLASEFRASSPDQSVHSRFLVPSRHAFMAPVLLNVTEAVWKPPAPDAELFAKMHGGEEWLIGA